MSVDYSAVYMFGLYFRDHSGVEEFLAENSIKELPEDFDIDDVLGDLGIEVEILNAYSGDEVILGWNISIDSDRASLIAEWNTLFKESEMKPEDHLEVRVC